MVTVPRRVQEESTSARLRRWGNECRRALRVALTPSDLPKTGQIYDIVGTQNLYGEESLFINFGYWKNQPATLDEASRDLARLLARTADFNASDTIVDCGCGYGDQDLLWVNEFGVKHITGVNLATEQIEISTQRVREAGLGDRVEYIHASATELPLEDESCTKVVALESAFHFPSRVDFFSEALRVLKPGGRLVTADIVPKKTIFNTRERDEVARLGWGAASPKAVRRSANVEGYQDLLRHVGFAEADAWPITDDVFTPVAKFLSKKLFEPDMKHINPLIRYTFTPVGFRLNTYKLDYIVGVARKA